MALQRQADQMLDIAYDELEQRVLACALTIACPVKNCGAQPNECCRMPDGSKMGTHTQRWQAKIHHTSDVMGSIRRLELAQIHLTVKG